MSIHLQRKEVLAMPVNKIRLEICGCSYLISTTDSEQYTLSLAEKLDHNMNEIMAQNPSASVTAAAVLSALDYLDEDVYKRQAFDRGSCSLCSLCGPARRSAQRALSKRTGCSRTPPWGCACRRSR